MKNLLLLSLILLSFYGCREKEDADSNVLPPATQTGANTGGALVNGEVWVARIEYDATFNNYIYSSASHRLKIFLREYNGSGNLFIYLDEENHIEEGEYILNSIDVNRGGFSKSNDYGGDYTTNSENIGVLTITKFDTNKNIVSGTFEFDAVNVNGEVLHITEGRFDKKFSQ